MKMALHFDTVKLALPVGLALRGMPHKKRITDGLDIRVSPAGSRRPQFALKPVPSGHWVSHQMPGTDWDLLADPLRWEAEARNHRVEVSDPWGRYLPLRFDAPLPAKKAMIWPGWRGWSSAQRSKIAPLLPKDAGASYIPDYLPLFPSAGASVAAGTALVTAQLVTRDAVGNLGNAGWAIVTIGIGTRVIGFGVAAGDGRVTISFAYPLLPEADSSEAALGRSEIIWDVRVRVYCDQLTSALEPDDIPDLGAIFDQLNQTPKRALATIRGPQPALPDQKLKLGIPLTLRTTLMDGSLSPNLFIKLP
jgi:hypothetical protein